jgi:hypothetical protein
MPAGCPPGAGLRSGDCGTESRTSITSGYGLMINKSIYFTWKKL